MDGIPVHDRLAFLIEDDMPPFGLCSSSGQRGHSTSLGDASLAVAYAGTGAVADAGATALCNQVKKNDPEGSIQSMLEFADSRDELIGCLVFFGSLAAKSGSLPPLSAMELDLY